MQNQSGFVAVEVLVLSGGVGDGAGSVESDSSSAGSLSAAGCAGAVSVGAAGWELTAGTGSAAAAGSCGVVGAGADLWIEITDSFAGVGEDGEPGSFEPGSGSVSARLPGPAVDDGVTFESRIVKAVVVSALVPVRGAVPASGGAASPGATMVEVTPLAELSDTTSASTCFSRRNFSPQPARVNAAARKTTIPGFCFALIRDG